MQCDAGCPEAALRGKACSCREHVRWPCTSPFPLPRPHPIADRPNAASFSRFQSRFQQFPVSLAAVSSVPCRRIPHVPSRTVTTHNTPIPHLSPPSSPVPHVHVHVPLPLLLPPFSLLFRASPPFWERDMAFYPPI